MSVVNFPGHRQRRTSPDAQKVERITRLLRQAAEHQPHKVQARATRFEAAADRLERLLERLESAVN